MDNSHDSTEKHNFVPHELSTADLNSKYLHNSFSSLETSIKVFVHTPTFLLAKFGVANDSPLRRIGTSNFKCKSIYLICRENEYTYADSRKYS